MTIRIPIDTDGCDPRPGHDALERAIAIKPRLRRALLEEWSTHGFFPCYAAILLRGDPTLSLSSLGVYFRSKTAPLMKLATALCWPLRVLQRFPAPARDGVSTRVSTAGLTSLRFHTFFTDAYLYEIIRSMITDEAVPRQQRQRCSAILLGMVDKIIDNALDMTVAGEPFKVFQFFPQKDMRVDDSTASARFLRLSGLDRVDADADDTFVVLEVLDDFLDLLRSGWITGLDEDRRASKIAALVDILERPYVKLAWFYQFRADGVATPRLNYTGVDSMGGVSTWFTRSPKEAPDLVVNVNVLRSMLVNGRRWRLFDSPEALGVARGILSFLWRNVESGLFRSDGAYAYYLPELFCAMYSRLFQVFALLDATQQHALDGERMMERIRAAVLSYVGQALSPKVVPLNAMDAALALSAAARLGSARPDEVSGWLRILRASFQERHPHYHAYEIFKGKIPTYMVYGSEVTTAAFVLDAIHAAESLAAATGTTPAPPAP